MPVTLLFLSFSFLFLSVEKTLRVARGVFFFDIMMGIISTFQEQGHLKGRGGLPIIYWCIHVFLFDVNSMIAFSDYFAIPNCFHFYDFRFHNEFVKNSRVLKKFLTISKPDSVASSDIISKSYFSATFFNNFQNILNWPKCWLQIVIW